MDQFPLIATIGFVMAGFLMEPAGITGEIIEVAKKAVGNIRGGLAMVTILACMIFAALSGSGPATTAAIGSIMIPGMIGAGYRKDDAAAVSATGGTLGILIPPSNPMIIYGVVANTSIAGLFMAGFIPGFVMTTSMCITAYCIARKRGYKGTGEKFSVYGLLKAIWDGKWALATPVIILGGIYCGVFTPTEAAEVGVLWTLFVGLFVYRKLTWKNISSALIRTSAFAGSATVLVGVSMAFSRLLTLYHIPQSVGAFLGSISTDPTITLLLIAFFIFLCGFVADTLAMVVVLAPVFLPITNALGIHPIQLGVLFVVFLGVTALKGIAGASIDGVYFKTAKFTIDKMVPIVGGMFSDTLETLVACSLIVKNAVGILGEVAIAARMSLPLLRLIAQSLLLRFAGAAAGLFGGKEAAGLLSGLSESVTLLFAALLSMSLMAFLFVAVVMGAADRGMMLW